MKANLRCLVVRRSLAVALSALGLAAAVLGSSSPALGHSAKEPASISATQAQFSVPWYVRPEFDRGTIAPNLRLERMLLLLRPARGQAKALDDFLESLQDRHSPDFHGWVTPTQFGERFGASAATIAAAKAWLEASGFDVAPVAQGGQWIEFSGSGAQVEAAFQTEVHIYSAGGQQHYANDTPILIPTELQPLVEGIVSLDGVEESPTTAGLEDSSASSSPFPDAPANSSPGAVSRAQFASLYNMKPLYGLGIDGTGQSIAIIARGDVSNSNGRPQDATSLLLAHSPQVLLNNPGCGTDTSLRTDLENSDHGSPDTFADPSQDAALDAAMRDAAWAGSIAPGAAVTIVASPSTRATDGADLSVAYAVDHAVARVLSSSYSRCGADAETTRSQFYKAAWRQAAAEGITPITAACDDQGVSPPPASSVYETAVKGSPQWLELLFDDAERQMLPMPGGRAQEPGVLSVTRASATEASGNGVRSFSPGNSGSPSAALAAVFALVEQYTGSAQGNANPRLAALANVPGIFRDPASAGPQAAGDSNSTGSFDAYQLATKWSADAATGTATITVAPSSATPVYGSAFTVTATLASTSTPAPTGTVQFTVDGAAQGTAALSTSGGVTSAALSFYTPIVGTHNLDAIYSGDATYASATAPIVSIVVSHGSSTTAIAAAPAVLTSSTPEVFTATVTDKVTTDAAGKFTGNVQFYDGTTPLATPVLLSDNEAVSSPVTLDATVSHAITAVYYGDGNWNGSVSPQLTLTAGAGASATVLMASSAVALEGGVVTLTASVTGTATVAGTLPTGNVSFYDGTNAIGQAAIVDNLGVATATFFTANLAGGSHQLTAVYQGDINFSASTSAVVDISVQGYTLVASANTLTLSRGASGAIIYTLKSAGGLDTAVQFGCAVPAASEMSCAFTPVSISVSGQTALSVTTTAPSGMAELRAPLSPLSGSPPSRPPLSRWYPAAGVSLAVLFLWPLKGKRGLTEGKRTLLLWLLFSATVMAVPLGCGSSAKSTGSPADPGTPLGAQTLTITTAVTLNGVTTTQHSYVTVNVQ